MTFQFFNWLTEALEIISEPYHTSSWSW